MSYCRKEGKDTIIFATKENHRVPSTVELPEPERPSGVILPDGSINWNCPCLGGMATGPCGLEFREAFSCFHYSNADPKGSNCLDAFTQMQSCMKQYPSLYASATGTDADDMDSKYLEDEKKREQFESNMSGDKVQNVTSASSTTKT